MRPVGFATLTTHLDHGSDPATGAVIPPIYLSTTFEQPSPGVPFSVPFDELRHKLVGI